MTHEFEDESSPPVAIPHTALSPEALRGVIESFILREGTDYGETEFSLEQKVAHILRQLERGEARILFDPNSETINVLPISPQDRQIIGRKEA